ncbi:MAG: hypothetical protein SGPRY_014130, partial [Prymnesium sp.]
MLDIRRSRARGSRPSGLTAGPTFVGRVDKLSLILRGTAKTAWWGIEHYPVVRSAAECAQPCVVVEAGAHQGTLALLAAKLNCTVYAFDSILRHLRIARSNLEMNSIPSGRVFFTHKKLGVANGSRLDELVPSGVRISLLKMDIDGMDAIAMRGASGLITASGIDVIHVEFSPYKHMASAGISDVDYLNELHAKGFEAYLDNCYKAGQPRLEEEISRTLKGMRCLAIVGADQKQDEQIMLNC